MNVNTGKISLFAAIAVLVATIGCAQNNDKKSTSLVKPNSAQNVVVRSAADGKKEYALVNGPIPKEAADPDQALLSSLNWQPLTEDMAIEASHKVTPSQVNDNSFKFVSSPEKLMSQAAQEKEDGSANFVYYGYGYPTWNAGYGYYNYYYPTYGYNNWFWPSYNVSATWAYSYNYWPTYYTNYNWWYYYPTYAYNYWGGYNYYWYARWW